MEFASAASRGEFAGALALSISTDGQARYIITEELARDPRLLTELLDLLSLSVRRQGIRRVA